MVEGLLQWIDTQITLLTQEVTWLSQEVQFLAVSMSYSFNYLWNILQALGAWIRAGASLIKAALLGVFHALAHLSFSDIWHAIKRAYRRFRDLIDWYKRNVQAPIDRLRRTIMDLYNRFFRPILRVLDSFRVFIRVLAIFNRRLAAQLDGALFRLEAKLMYPITALLKRINELSSYTRAIITSLGLLDRVLLVESLRRDASLVWEVLTNPRARIYGPIVKPEPRPSIAQTAQDIHVYVQTGAGPTADRMDDLDRAFRQAQIDLA